MLSHHLMKGELFMNNQLPKAGFGIRAIAGILDTLIIILPVGVIIHMLTGKISLNWTQGLAWNIPYLLYLVIFPVYWQGYIVGKKLVNVKVVKIDDTHLTLGDMFIRDVVGKFLLGLITLGLTTIISGIMVFLGNNKRAIHDILAKTYVENEYI